MNFNLPKLPSSIIFYILSFVEIKCVTNCCKVSKSWNEAINNPRIWKNLYEKTFMSSPPNIFDWKKLYGNRYLATKNIIPGKCTMSRLRKHTKSVKGIYVDQSKIISLGSDGFICLIDLKTGEVFDKVEYNKEPPFWCTKLLVEKEVMVLCFLDGFSVADIKDNKITNFKNFFSPNNEIVIGIWNNSLVCSTKNNEIVILDIQDPSKRISEFKIDSSNLKKFQVDPSDFVINEEGWIYENFLFKPMDNPTPMISVYNLKQGCSLDYTVDLEGEEQTKDIQYNYGETKGFLTFSQIPMKFFQKKIFYYYRKFFYEKDLETGNLKKISKNVFEHNSDRVSVIDLDHDIICAGTENGSVVLIDGRDIKQGKLDVGGHSGRVNTIQLMGSYLVTGGNDGNILVWDFLVPKNELAYHYFYENEIRYMQQMRVKVENKFDQFDPFQNMKPLDFPPPVYTYVYSERPINPYENQKKSCVLF
eukprot:TRINITY_DN4625_c0_g1_i1.p1 TRINITY_DN4625_c0_g1~~TRINITY_DN4625_c0_g1_i1.p1  ORF type:complete len:474 (+),score=123.21 TRINITY_DN4625_c0_g1_i1:1-1422(+)